MPYKPSEQDRKTVTQASGLGLPEDQIARLVINPRTRKGVSVDTLRKHFREELSDGRANANAAVSGALYEKAIEGNTTAMIWWEKTRMGMKDTQVNEIQGEGIGINLVMNYGEKQKE